MAATDTTRIDHPLTLAAIRAVWIGLAAAGLVQVTLFLRFLHQSYQIPPSPLADLGAASSVIVWYSTVLTVVSLIVFYGLSGFLMWVRGHDRISVIVAIFLIALGAARVDTYLPIVRDAVLAAYPITGFTVPLLGFVGWGGFMAFTAFFPDGRLVVPYAPFVLLYGLALVMLFTIPPPDSPLFYFNLPPLLFFFLTVTISACAIYLTVYRYRRVSTFRQRQQTKWVAYAMVISIVLMISFFAQVQFGSLFAFQSPVIILQLTRGLAGFSLVLIPVTITVAILQYRLWDIDLIIRRTLQYATITLLLGATYFGGVVVLQAILSQIAGGESPLAVVASTLLIAALFNPLRTRVQAFVDRRFYRQKYDTQQTLARFSEIARDEVVLEEIEQALVSTVHDTMQPEHVSLWLRPSEHER